MSDTHPPFATLADLEDDCSHPARPGFPPRLNDAWSKPIQPSPRTGNPPTANVKSDVPLPRREPGTGRPYSPRYAVDSRDHPPGRYQVGGEHYLKMDLSPWDVIDTWQLEERIGFYRGNALKYLLRSGRKGGPDGELEDARKAEYYAKKLVETLARQGRGAIHG